MSADIQEERATTEIASKSCSDSISSVCVRVCSASVARQYQAHRTTFHSIPPHLYHTLLPLPYPTTHIKHILPVYLATRLYIFTPLHLYIFISLRLYIFTSLHLYIFTSLYLYIFISLYLYIFIFLHLYIFISLYLYIFICNLCNVVCTHGGVSHLHNGHVVRLFTHNGFNGMRFACELMVTYC